MRKGIYILIVAIVCVSFLTQSCKAKDCKGRRKTTKTAMGGWL